ncbi:MAG: LytTR family transcriptional regulator [Prolixibacteraceae bacterium]|nr:LytTR family transcriptional regulator [Prolixibacteraceae bacterium]
MWPKLTFRGENDCQFTPVNPFERLIFVLYIMLFSLKINEMVFNQILPDYLTTRKNTIIQIAFTTVFAFVFITIYRPFGYENWYTEVKHWQLIVASAVVVLTGMIVIILSRMLLLYTKRTQEITLATYIWFIVAEIIAMGLFYTLFEIVILKDQRSPLFLFINAVQNTSLILLIPYTVTILFFAWSDIKKKFEQVVGQFKDPSELFIPFKDEKGNLRVTIKCSDLLYLEANDNYVNIQYTNKNKLKTYMVRNSLKNFENELKDYPIIRCHRKYSINIKNVKMLKKAKKGYQIIINSEQQEIIPVSRSYENQVIKQING